MDELVRARLDGIRVHLSSVFGWEIAHADRFATPPGSLTRIVARTEGYMYATNVGFVQGPFSVARSPIRNLKKIAERERTASMRANISTLSMRRP